MAKLHRSDFINEIKNTWPHLVAEINAEEGLLHFEVAVVRKFAQRLIDGGDPGELARCFALMERFYLGGNAKMRDAVDVSFVEDLDFRDTKKRRRASAWDILPDALKDLYVRFHGPRET